RSEIERLLEIVQDANPNTILEIGTATGGTLFLFCRHASENSLIVSIDLRKGRFGHGYPAAKIPLYKSFACKQQKITLIRGDSHREETRRRAKEALNGRSIDFLFIDGDHTYEGVKADFEAYSKFVTPGGIVAFHDIAEHPPHVGCEVSRYWNEVKSRYHHTELVENPLQGWAGIGVLYL